MSFRSLLCGLLCGWMVSPVLAVTIDLPAAYDQNKYDMLVLNDSIPERSLGYSVRNLQGDHIAIKARYLNFNALNVDFGDTVGQGSFAVVYNGSPVISVSNITNNTFMGISGDIAEFPANDSLALTLILGDSSDAIGIFRPWLTVTDSIRPAPIVDLTPVTVLSSRVILSWTTPGDDNLSGQAQLYELRYSQYAPQIDTLAWWDSAFQALQLPLPGIPGSLDSCAILGLVPDNAYYFALVAFDELGNRSAISNIAACTTSIVSNFCLYYDGGDFARVPFNAVLNTGAQITLEAWYFLESDFGGMHAAILDKPAPDHSNPYYQYNLTPVVPPDSIPDFYAQLAVNNAYNPFEIQTAGAVDAWMHVALTYDGYTELLFLNGNLIGEIAAEGIISSFDTGIKFGALENLDAWFFKGLIDEVRLWNVARTQSEIQEDMHRSLSGDEAGLTAYWTFNEGAGQVFHDYTANHADGHLGDSLDVDGRDPIWVESSAPIDTLVVSLDNSRSEIPDRTRLLQSYPNPFNSVTQISFSLPEREHVRLEIFDMLGRKVSTLADGSYQAGIHQVTWDGRSMSGQSLSSGIYFYRLRADDLDQTRKMLLIK